MGEKTNPKRYTGCACGCGQATWNTYKPGHDSKHVAQFVRRAILETESPWERGQVWRAALRSLPTDALRWKFRRQMYKSAERHLGYAIDQMADENWQRASHLRRILCRDDNYFDVDATWNERVLATYAAALGWTRHAINVKNS